MKFQNDVDYSYNPFLTNGERIRRMDDEELAEFLTAITDPDWHKNDEFPDYKPTVDGWMAWLKSPAEVNE